MTLLNAVLQNDTVKVLVLDNHKTFFEPSFICAIVAIVISIYTLIQTIKHNKLMLDPILDLISEISFTDNLIKIELANFGLGTAKIVSFKIEHNGYIYNNYNNLFSKNAFDKNKDTKYLINIGNAHISSSTKTILYEKNCFDVNELIKIGLLLQEIDVSIEYESIYGTRKKFHKNKLDF